MPDHDAWPEFVLPWDDNAPAPTDMSFLLDRPAGAHGFVRIVDGHLITGNGVRYRMIEKKAAMENLDEILAVPGIGMVQFGPTNYSVSIGKPGQGRGAEVQAVHRRMIERTLALGLHPRVEVASFEQARPYLDMGVRHFCIGWDIVTIYSWCTQQGAGMRELLALKEGSGGE